MEAFRRPQAAPEGGEVREVGESPGKAKRWPLAIFSSAHLAWTPGFPMKSHVKLKKGSVLAMLANHPHRMRCRSDPAVERSQPQRET